VIGVEVVDVDMTGADGSAVTGVGVMGVVKELASLAGDVSPTLVATTGGDGEN
jgi:hypothetical protein